MKRLGTKSLIVGVLSVIGLGNVAIAYTPQELLQYLVLSDNKEPVSLADVGDTCTLQTQSYTDSMEQQVGQKIFSSGCGGLF